MASLLDFIIFSPLAMALIILFWSGRNSREYYKLSCVLSFFHLILTSSVLFFFDKTSSDLQLVHKFDWIPSFGISYFVGVDGLSLLLVIMTSFLGTLVVFSSKNISNGKQFFVSLFTLKGTMIGSFLALDAVLFYTFFEVSLIPMYFLVGLWGGPRRIYAALKLFLFTAFGSLFMLLGIVFLILMTKEQLGHYSASILDFYRLEIPFVSKTLFSTQTLLFLSFCLAFGIKVPVFPFHTWLPDAHVEAPTAGSVILAGIMLKMGTYGFMRFVLPLFPDSTYHFSEFFMLLGVIAIVYGALVAMAQTDIKKLVAYSSVSHMGYVILGLFALSKLSLAGSLYQMLNHGISTGALFFLVGMIYEKTKTRQIYNYGGLAERAPLFSIFFLIVTFSSIAIPMTGSFVGEFLILSGSFKTQPVFTGIALMGVILSAGYMLLMYKNVFFGAQNPLWKEKRENMDLKRSDQAILTPLVILIFWMGIYPNHFLSWSEKSIEKLVRPGDYRLNIYSDERRRRK